MTSRSPAAPAAPRAVLEVQDPFGLVMGAGRGANRPLGETLGDSSVPVEVRKREYARLAALVDAGELEQMVWTLRRWPDHIAAGSLVHDLSIGHLLPMLSDRHLDAWEAAFAPLADALGWQRRDLRDRPLNVRPMTRMNAGNLSFWVRHETWPASNVQECVRSLDRWACGCVRLSLIDALGDLLFPGRVFSDRGRMRTAMSAGVYLRVRLDQGLIGQDDAVRLLDEFLPDRPGPVTDAAERVARLRDDLQRLLADTPQERARVQEALDAAAVGGGGRDDGPGREADGEAARPHPGQLHLSVFDDRLECSIAAAGA